MGDERLLSRHHRDLVTATVPALRQRGEEITRAFYQSLFNAHPELLDVFNIANQRDGGQARSLAASVLAYAEHIDHPERLGGMVARIANKHGSLEVRPEHYPIVGQHLLGAINRVLGDSATAEILEAWSAAYGQLAKVMTGAEAALYEASEGALDGWRGFKPFRVTRKVRESEVISSFYLEPADSAPPPTFKPGQFVSIRVRPPGNPNQQIRQYSLSSAPNGRDYRISVKREDAPADVSDAPHGAVSHYLHGVVREGDLLDVHAPLGDFILEPGNTPVVLLSGGVGITAVLGIFEQLASTSGNGRQAAFVHAARGRGHHAFGDRVRELARARPGLTAFIAYEEAGSEDVQGVHHDRVGRLTADVIRAHAPVDAALFYHCGPPGFTTAVGQMLDELGVVSARRRSEAFAPDPSFAIELG